MAGRWLFRVFDAFNVRGRGWILVPGVARDNPGVEVGDRVELRGGKGPARTGVVRGIGSFDKRGGAAPELMPLLVELDPTDKPLILGAEVWRVEGGGDGDGMSDGIGDGASDGDASDGDASDGDDSDDDSNDDDGDDDDDDDGDAA